MEDMPPDFLIVADHVSNAWYEIIRNIRNDGYLIKANKDRDVNTLDICAMIVLKNDAIQELLDKKVHKDVPMKLGIDGYIEQFIFDSDEYLKSYKEQPYTYAGRLREQLVNMVVHELIEPFNRRCIAHTWRPCADQPSKNPPCLQTVQIRMYDDERCEVITTWRSHDAFGGWSWNNVALMTMLNSVIFEPLGIRCVKLVEFNASLHIYDYDWEAMKEASMEMVLL